MIGNDSYTVSLLHMNGANGSTTFTDSAVGGTHSWTAYNSAKITTAQSEFGGACGLFTASTKDYISTPYSADFDFGTGDFTIDFWVRFNANPNTLGTGIFGIYNLPSGSDSVYFVDVGGTWYFVSNISGVTKMNYNFSWSPTYGGSAVWYHIALVRNGTNVYIFINGAHQTLTATVPVDAHSITPTVNSPFVIGRLGNYNGYYLDGWVDEFRVSKGIARWILDFTPPIDEYTTASVVGNSGFWMYPGKGPNMLMRMVGRNSQLVPTYGPAAPYVSWISTEEG